MSAFGKAFTEKFFANKAMAIGNIVTHPDGRKVKITDGQLFGEHGFSNWWTWREVKADGTLGKEESGYGW